MNLFEPAGVRDLLQRAGAALLAALLQTQHVRAVREGLAAFRARCEEAGVAAFFEKPIKVNAFIDAVCVVLDQRLGRFL